MKHVNVWISSMLAGLFISISGCVYLGSGKTPVGAVLFAVGLFAICTRGMALFTGRVGYLVSRSDKANCIRELLVIWVGNLVACAAVGAMMSYAKPAYREMAIEVATLKLSQAPLQTFVLGVFCGVLMYLAVDHYRSWQGDLSRFAGILLAVPAFILAGFEHVVADMFFLSLGLTADTVAKTVIFLLICTLGNACGAWLLAGWDKLREK